VACVTRAMWSRATWSRGARSVAGLRV